MYLTFSYSFIPLHYINKNKTLIKLSIFFYFHIKLFTNFNIEIDASKRHTPHIFSLCRLATQCHVDS